MSPQCVDSGRSDRPNRRKGSASLRGNSISSHASSPDAPQQASEVTKKQRLTSVKRPARTRTARRRRGGPGQTRAVRRCQQPSGKQTVPMPSQTTAHGLLAFGYLLHEDRPLQVSGYGSMVCDPTVPPGHVIVTLQV